MRRHAVLLRLACAALCLVAALIGPAPRIVQAQENPLGANAAAAALPLQDLIRNERPSGQLYVSIPFAEVFGGSHGYAPYCSPQIRTTNASNRTVQEMLAGIRYRDRRGRPVGSTITRVFLLRVDAEETHYFGNIDADDCEGLSAQVEVIRCVYEDGAACAADVVAVNFGAIPLATASAPPIPLPKERK